MKKIVMSVVAAVAAAGVACGVIGIALATPAKVKPLLLQADGGQNGAGAKIIMFGNKGSITVPPTPSNPKGMQLENVKLTEKVDILTAPLWTLRTDSGVILTFAPSASGWICESCGLQKLPVMWHVAKPSE